MIERHKLAVCSLVNRVGGLHELTSQGLASLLAVTDIAYASAEGIATGVRKHYTLQKSIVSTLMPE